MSDTVKIVVFKKGAYAEADVSKPHVIVPEDGATVSCSPALALKLIRQDNAELDESELEEATEVEVEDEPKLEPIPVITTEAFTPVVQKNETPPVHADVTLADIQREIARAEEAAQTSSDDADPDVDPESGEGEKTSSALD